ncbi:hypothetical protein H6F43_03490 [Leptolyngbya sp. FACHB-36]|uniref:hypothetical protein n=1 Tax=Leptolyngbya sp. FACHB-36 TaxID=2692808 RepID=UPI001680D988|nr:hypothetical protein [Leptolyngbya sp. FACHB-36]MBD2019245.1 hypothetical protein [Leptolyngbya sp. FACHB-36]
MDYSLLADYDGYHCNEAPDDPEPPAAPAPKPQCGMCENYQRPKPGMWGYCRLRAAADIHPCNLPPWDSYAERCHFYSEEVPF